MSAKVQTRSSPAPPTPAVTSSAIQVPQPQRVREQAMGLAFRSPDSRYDSCGEPRRALRGGQRSLAPAVVGVALRESGQPLDRTTRLSMERRFGQDFSSVRIHADGRAVESARAVHALAYTAGNHVVFEQGQFSPATAEGSRLLAHELTHVVQQRGVRADPANLSVRPRDDAHEDDASEAAKAFANPNSKIRVRTRASEGAVQRFATSEHREIGDAAYQAALPQSTAAAQGPDAPKLDPALATALRNFRYRHATGKQSTYGELVTMADDVASFQLLEDQDKERAGQGFRVPILSRIWDFIGDNTHYLDLAARNLQHFHPHNFKAWQAYHWTALRQMRHAYEMEAQADQLNIQIVNLFREFDTRQQRARTLIEQQDAEEDHSSTAAENLSNAIAKDTDAMQRILTAIAQKQQKVAELREKAKGIAVHATALNAFGDHFLTDAYAGGHIVTPRKDLLQGYATKLFGVVNVEGVLHCTSIPSLAWHDLDNKRGVRVKNRAGEVWTTYGDNYLHNAAPKGEPTTMGQVVKATARSVRHMWESAAGRQPTSLMDVLELLPAPNLDPAIYPNWTPEEWGLQLRYAAGEQVGMNYDAMSATPRSNQPAEKVPEPEGNQIGAGILSARATCWNAISIFSYKNFVEPMLVRIRQEYKERFFTGSAGQVLPDTAEINPQASIVGHAALASLIGALAGVGIGFLAGHGLGALIGGIAGFALGALVGGLIGSRRDKPEPAGGAA